MRKLGFKLFSTNLQTAPALVKECAEFVATKKDMFMELMVIPDSSDDDFMKIKRQLGDVEVRIHAPYTNFDTGNKEAETQNRKLIAISQKIADIFNSKTIVVHGGYGHGQKYIEETARQFKGFNDKRIVIENIPYYGSEGEALHGNTAAAIAYIMDKSGCGFCFDFSHAICAALSLNMDIQTQLKSLFELKPTVYHLCDGDINKADDLHLHLGDGNYPLKNFLRNYTDENAYITLETGHGVEQHIDLRIKDYEYIKSLSED